MDSAQRHWYWILIVPLLALSFMGAERGFIGRTSAQASVVADSAMPPNHTTAGAQTPETADAVAPSRLDDQQAVYALQNQVIAVYGKVSPAVVNISNRGYVEDMFMRSIPQEGSGSGLVYDNDGHIVTNFHVVENAEELLVTLANGEVFDAALIGSNLRTTWQ